MLPLLEGFEQVTGNVPSGGIIWDFLQGPLAGGTNPGTFSVTRSGLHVTQGVHSALTSYSGDKRYWLYAYGDGSTYGLDLSSYNNILLDVYVQSCSSNVNFYFYVEGANGGGFREYDSTPGQTGDTSVNLDISGVNNRDKLYIEYGMLNADFSGSYEMTCYMDNLRGS